MKKAINWLLCVIFLLFAYVQFNDPDPYVWVVIYGVVALLFGMSNFIVIPKMVLAALISGLVIFSIFHLGYFIDWLQSENHSELFGEMVYEKPYIERTREFMGLIIAISSLLFLRLQLSNKA